MAWTYDTTTDRGRVRLLIGDSDTDNQIFSDAEIDAFLALEDDTVKLAAAAGLEAIASKQAYIQKVMTVGDTTTDGAKLAKAFLDQAKAWRGQVATAAADADAVPSFDFAEWSVTPAAAGEIIWNSALRDL